LAQFRTTADLVDSVLRRCGELTNGNSPYESQALDYLNEIHQTIINGGNEFEIDIDENWSWAKAKQPIILELQPKYDTGTVSLTQGSEAGTFSSAPSPSMEGRYIFISNRPEKMRISQHTAGQAGFELDSAYVGDTGSGLSFDAVQLDYELKSDYYIIDSSNNIIDFEEVVSTPLVATLTNGVYKASDLATEVKTQLDSAGSSVYTITFDTSKDKFKFVSNGAGGIFTWLGSTGANIHRNAHAVLGLDSADLSGALTYNSTYIKDGIVRLFEPLTVFTATGQHKVLGISELKMTNDYPINNINEGIPTTYSIIKETAHGRITIRFNKYPKDLTRVELDFIAIPRDLKDNAASEPLIPRKFRQILEFGACFYVLMDKEDNKAQMYATLAGTKLKALVKQNRKALSKTGQNFGNVVARTEKVSRYSNNRRLTYGEPES